VTVPKPLDATSKSSHRKKHWRHLGGYASTPATPFWYSRQARRTPRSRSHSTQRVGYGVRPTVQIASTRDRRRRPARPSTPPALPTLRRHGLPRASMTEKTLEQRSLLSWTIDHHADPVNGEQHGTQRSRRESGEVSIMARFAKAPNGRHLSAKLDGQKKNRPAIDPIIRTRSSRRSDQPRTFDHRRRPRVGVLARTKSRTRRPQRSLLRLDSLSSSRAVSVLRREGFSSFSGADLHYRTPSYYNGVIRGGYSVTKLRSVS